MSKPKHHMTRHELKEDQVLGAMEGFWSYVGLHKEKLIIAFVMIVVSAGIYVSLEKVQQRRREDVFLSLHQAKKDLKGTHKDKAMVQLKNIVDKYPKSVEALEALLLLGEEYYNLGKYQMCVDLTKHMLKKKGASSKIGQQLLLIQALSFEQMGEFQYAAKTYVRLIDQDPRTYIVPEAKLSLARCYRQLSRDDEAKELYQSVILDYPESNWAQKAASLVALMKS